jgi:hypothetical protein
MEVLFARIAVGAAAVLTLMEIDPHYPEVDANPRKQLHEARAQLEAEGDER